MTTPRQGSGPHPDGDPDARTETLLRAALLREAAAVQPSTDGLARILAASRTARTRDLSEVHTVALTVSDPATPPERVIAPDPAPPHPAPSSGPGAAPGPLASPHHGTSTGNTVPLGYLRPPPAPAPRRPVRWLPLLAAAAAVVVLAGSLGLTRLGMIRPPGLASVVGGPDAVTQSAHPPAAEPLPVYLLEEQHDRWALVREFTPTTLTDPADRLVEALRLAIAGEGTDPDHTSAWKAAGLTGDGTLDGDVEVTTSGGTAVRLSARLIGTARAGGEDGDARDAAPPAALAVAQLVWTATATTHDTAAVRISGPAPGSRLFGTLPLDRAFTRNAADPRAPVWVSSLVDGQRLTAGRAVLQGDAVWTGPASVTWRLVGPGGTEVSTGTASLRRESGAGTPRTGERGVWDVTLQLTGAGRYLFEVSQAWPGADPADPPWTDTKVLLAA